MSFRLSLIAGGLAALAATAVVAAEPPTPSPDALYQKMLALDTAMFDSFNHCNDPAQFAKHAAFFAKDVEFYHDLGGVMWGADTVLESTKKNVCGKFWRQLDLPSFRVWPIPGYGAMVMGTHRFCHTPTTCEGVGEFTTIWRQTGDEWVVTRALSYAHASIEPPVPAKK